MRLGTIKGKENFLQVHPRGRREKEAKEITEIYIYAYIEKKKKIHPHIYI